MEVAITKRQWNISKKDLKAFCHQKMEDMLSSFNRACSGDFYIADYYHKKFIIDSPYSLFLCGYSKEFVAEQGFAFFGTILKKENLNWIMQMNRVGYKTLFRLPVHQRTKAIISYDLAVITADGEDLILHHKVVPYQLCKNGNMWLGLCHVSVSSSKTASDQAIFFNAETGERYNLIGGEFELSDTKPITKEDMQILRCLIKGFADKQTISQLGDITLSAFKTKKQRLFEKLDVNTSTEAIHKAHLMGII